MVRRVVTVVAVCTLAGSIAWSSTPVISNINGPLEQGSTLVLQGVNFGSKPVAAPLKYDNFDQGSSEQDLVGWQFRVNGGGQAPRYSDWVQRVGNGQAAKCTFGDGQQLAAFGLNDTADLTSVYLDFWVYFSETVPASVNYKLYLLDPGPLAGLPNQFLRFSCRESGQDATFTNYGVGSDGISASLAYPGWTTGEAQSNWSHIQVFLRQSDAGVNNGILECWIDGSKHLDRSDYLSRSVENSSDWRNIWLGYYYSHMISPACDAGGDAAVYFDNVYIDTTQARVELGNAPVYEDCTHREIQVPTAWSDTEVVVTVNVGSFSDGEGVWAFIITEPGEMNGSAGPYSLVVPGPGRPSKPVND